MIASRVILVLTILLLLFMPLMEHLWSWDGFLRGGQDFELGLLSVLAFCGLVALMAQQVEVSPLLSLLLAHRRKRSPLRWLMDLSAGMMAIVVVFAMQVERAADHSIPLCLLSLRI